MLSNLFEQKSIWMHIKHMIQTCFRFCLEISQYVDYDLTYFHYLLYQHLTRSRRHAFIFHNCDIVWIEQNKIQIKV